MKHRIKGSVVTIGVFDGVHIGHRKIIKKVVDRTRTLGLKSVVVTFDPHPLKILRPGTAEPLSLVSLQHRIRLIRALDVDYLLILKFTRMFSLLSPSNFVKDVLINRLGAKEIYVGENFYFGRNASGGAHILKKISQGFGCRVYTLKPVKISNRIVSSSLIRKLILRGILAEASRLLARPVSILGTVVEGSKLARLLGYPTANVNPHHEIIPPTGVYAVKINLDGRWLKGILNIGVRPTFYSSRDREPTIEVHIFDFTSRIYGKDIEIFFIKKIRDERRFKNAKELIAQIRRDERTARSVLR